MTYAERLAEFVKITGHKPGEMNKPCAWTVDECHRENGFPCNDHLRVSLEPPALRRETVVRELLANGLITQRQAMTRAEREHIDALPSLEPPAQSAGPGRCNRYTRAAALGDPKPCVLDAGHEGGHEL